jgi:hypothetical protein
MVRQRVYTALQLTQACTATLHDLHCITAHWIHTLVCCPPSAAVPSQQVQEDRLVACRVRHIIQGRRALHTHPVNVRCLQTTCEQEAGEHQSKGAEKQRKDNSSRLGVETACGRAIFRSCSQNVIHSVAVYTVVPQPEAGLLQLCVGTTITAQRVLH